MRMFTESNAVEGYTELYRLHNKLPHLVQADCTQLYLHEDVHTYGEKETILYKGVSTTQIKKHTTLIIFARFILTNGTYNTIFHTFIDTLSDFELLTKRDVVLKVQFLG